MDNRIGVAERSSEIIVSSAQSHLVGQLPETPAELGADLSAGPGYGDGPDRPPRGSMMR